MSHAHSLDHGFPDHYPVFCELSLERPVSKKQTVQYRRTKAINLCELSQDISASALSVVDFTTKSVSDLVALYNAELQQIIDKHAPLIIQVITVRPNADWYTPEVRAAKQERRRAERFWISTNLTIHREIFLERRKKVNAPIRLAKENYYQTKVAECAGSNEMFKLVHTLLG